MAVVTICQIMRIEGTAIYDDYDDEQITDCFPVTKLISTEDRGVLLCADKEQIKEGCDLQKFETQISSSVVTYLCSKAVIEDYHPQPPTTTTTTTLAPGQCPPGCNSFESLCISAWAYRSKKKVFRRWIRSGQSHKINQYQC